MPNRHKHADEIIAWANGETIEFRYKTKLGWSDWLELEHCEREPLGWYEDHEYRVKPKKKTPGEVLCCGMFPGTIWESYNNKSFYECYAKKVIDAYKKGELDYE